MNAWEFLGLPPDHRPKNKIVQLVKNWQEVPESKKQYPYYGQVKKDGVFGLVIVTKDDDGNFAVAVFGRTGEQLSNTEAIVSRFQDGYIAEGVYIGEVLTQAECSLEELSGILNPNRVNKLDVNQEVLKWNLYIALHDCLTTKMFIEGTSSGIGYHTRHASLMKRIAGTDLEESVLPYTVIYDAHQKDLFTKACIAAKEEGAVYKKPGCEWEAGHKGFHQMKEVRDVTYDLKCVGYEEGSGKYKGKVANLIFRWKEGETIKAMLGKGYTHADAEKMFIAITHLGAFDGEHLESPIGKVFRVRGLQDSSKGKIRLPKVMEERHDKSEGDF